MIGNDPKGSSEANLNQFITRCVDRAAFRDEEAAQQKAAAVVGKLRAMKLERAAKVVEEGFHETLRFFAFPSEHHLHLRTNNPLERLIREIRRRSRVVGCFPDGRSALMLACARLRHVAGTRRGSRCYMDMSRLREMENQTGLAA